MFVARVAGKVWVTRKSPGLEKRRLLLVDRMDRFPDLTRGERVLAVCDRVDAGEGDYVLVMDEGGSARSILHAPEAPIRTIIVGVIDQITVGDITYHVSGSIRKESA